MRTCLGVLALWLAASAPALSQGFDVTVPALGAVTTTVGMSASMASACTEEGKFPPGQASTPFTVWAHMEYDTLARDISIALEHRHFGPTGALLDQYAENKVFRQGDGTLCMRWEFYKLNGYGDHRMLFFVNGVEVGRYTVSLEPR